MLKLISIDPGKCKCGLVLVDLNQKKVDQALVIDTEFLPPPESCAQLDKANSSQ